MKLNKLSKYVLLLFGFTFLLSCNEDRLDLMPVLDRPLDGGIETTEDLQKVLNTAYGSISSSNAFGTNLLVYGELLSDNAFVSLTNDGYFLGVNGMTWTDNSADVSVIWNQLYAAVINADLVIYSELPPEISNTQEVKEIRAQARAIRGLAYFYLYQYFSPSPDIDANSEYGIILKNHPYAPENTDAARSTAQETVAAILDDLTAAVVDLPETAPNKYTFTKTVGNFILAKVYSYIKDDQKAMEYANKVINNSPSSYNFISNDETEYVDYFSSPFNIENQENKPETIWEIPQTPNFNFSVNAHMGVFFARTGQHRSILYRDAFKGTFAVTDIRYGLWDGQGPTADEPRGNFIKKWQRTNDEGPFTQNIKVFRMTEAKFILWESMAKLGQGQQALAAVNDFAIGRGGEGNYSGDALTAVLTEKQKEFFGEGTRFYDLKRNSLSIVKPSNCSSNCDVSPTDKLFVFPIPFTELNLNPLAVQNPGW